MIGNSNLTNLDKPVDGFLPENEKILIWLWWGRL